MTNNKTTNTQTNKVSQQQNKSNETTYAQHKYPTQPKQPKIQQALAT